MSSVAATLEVWEFPEGFELDAIVAIVDDRLTPPDVRAHLVSERGDVLTLQLVEGKLTPHVRMPVYVRGRGAFDVVRREHWPRGRVLLTLRARPEPAR